MFSSNWRAYLHGAGDEQNAAIQSRFSRRIRDTRWLKPRRAKGTRDARRCAAPFFTDFRTFPRGKAGESRLRIVGRNLVVMGVQRVRERERERRVLAALLSMMMDLLISCTRSPESGSPLGVNGRRAVNATFLQSSCARRTHIALIVNDSVPPCRWHRCVLLHLDKYPGRFAELNAAGTTSCLGNDNRYHLAAVYSSINNANVPLN